jgi:protein TonB
MPQYPRIAWVDRIEGNVQVQFNVSSQGVVENIRVVRASHPVFETNVIDAVSRYRFNPGAQRGVTETFRFTLAGNAADPEPVVTASES